MKSKTLKSIVASVLSVAMLMSFVACGDGGSEKDKKNDSADASASDNADVNSDRKSTIDKNVKVGDYVTFGSYEQDNDTSNGKEPIEWLVLDVQSDKVLLLSKYVLDEKAYNDEEIHVTWEGCSLRNWLNNDFSNSAFTKNEQKKILTSHVTAYGDPYGSAEPGNDTQDKVFLLSAKEVSGYFESKEEIKCEPTAFAAAQISNNANWTTCSWWARSATRGYFESIVACNIDNSGNTATDGYPVDLNAGVRPAMWVTIG